MNGQMLLMDDSESSLDMAAAMYQRLRREGASRAAAKRSVYEGYPFLKDHETAFSGDWGRCVQAVERELALAAAVLDTPPGTATPEAAPVTAMGFARRMFALWAARTKPKVGDTFTFSSAQWMDAFEILTGKRPNSTGFPNEFLDSQKAHSQLQREGWKFVAGGNRELYEATIVAMPEPPAPAPLPKLYTEEDVQRVASAAVAAAMARLLSNGSGE